MVNKGQGVVERVRWALGRRETIAPASPLLAACLTKPVNGTDLAELFSLELEKVGGSVSHVRSDVELKAHLARILIAEKPELVAVSDVVASVYRDILESVEFEETHFITPPEFPEKLLSAGVGITTADYAIADTGTLVLLSGGECHRLASLLPPVHVCLLDKRRIFPNLTELLNFLHKNVYSDQSKAQATTFITGPSRTADIEQTLTTGVHGPYRLRVLLMDSF